MWTELDQPENEDIVRELTDSRFTGRTHACRATYAVGCRGPLCRKIERDNTRQRWERLQNAKGKEVRRAEPGPARARDDFLARVIAWHKNMRLLTGDGRQKILEKSA